MADLRVLVLEWLSFLLVSLLAVWITVWAPGYWKLLKKCLSPLRSSDLNHSEQTSIRIGRKKTSDDENSPSREDHGQPTLSNILSRSHTAEEAFIALVPRILDSNIGVTLLAITLCASIFLVIAGAGIAVSFIVLDGNALSICPDCGMWVSSGINNTANPMGAIMDAVESYYISCYENDPSTQACGLFTDENLYINYTEGTECPFAGDICALGKYSAISLDTGYLDSKVLGINSRYRPFFRRRSICAPLITDGYNDTEFDNTTSFTSIKFYYGTRIDIDDNATYSQIRSPFYENLFSPSGYEIKTVSTTLKYALPIQSNQRKSGTLSNCLIDNLYLSANSKAPWETHSWHL